MISFFTVRIDIKMRSIVNSTCMTFHLSIATAPNLCLYECPYFENSILFGFRIVKVFIQLFWLLANSLSSLLLRRCPFYDSMYSLIDMMCDCGEVNKKRVI